MHQIIATVGGEPRVLVEVASCESAFDYFCAYLNEYEWNQLEIAGDCNDDPNEGNY